MYLLLKVNRFRVGQKKIKSLPSSALVYIQVSFHDKQQFFKMNDIGCNFLQRLTDHRAWQGYSAALG